MNASTTDQFRKRLLAIRQRLQDDIESRVQTVPEIIQTPGDEVHTPTHTADHDVEALDVEVPTGIVQQVELQSVEEAIQRLNSGTFGQCTDCGQSISQERLEALPWAGRCSSCERTAEAESAGTTAS